MKKFFFAALCIICFQTSQAQITDSTRITRTDSTIATTSTPKQNRERKKIDISNRSSDHFMLQYGFDNWATSVDSVKPSGFSRFFNAYFMLDKPFKTNPHYSVGLGLGIGSSNMFFKNTYVDVKSNSALLPFRNVDSANHFKKFKLTTVFLEAPIELRYSSDPENANKAFKVALGVKVGTLLKAYTKGKTLQDKNGSTINAYIAKESSKRFFNSTRLAATARVGLGIFSLYGSYQITGVLKDVAGPDIKPYSIGLTISGL
jgi:hypothetical protein